MNVDDTKLLLKSKEAKKPKHTPEEIAKQAAIDKSTATLTLLEPPLRESSHIVSDAHNSMKREYKSKKTETGTSTNIYSTNIVMPSDTGYMLRFVIDFKYGIHITLMKNKEHEISNAHGTHSQQHQIINEWKQEFDLQMIHKRITKAHP